MSSGESHKIGPALHGILLFAFLIIVAVAFPQLIWPWYLLIPIVAYGTAVTLITPLRRTMPKLALGKVGGAPLACATTLTVATSVALLSFHYWLRPDVTEFAARLPVEWFGNILLAGACLGLVNAALEELVFRGILWESVAGEWNDGAALGVTATLFGVAHLHGYPPGIIGAIMAGLYGVALGAMRWWTGGLALAYFCHVFADATILGMVATTGAFDGERVP